MKVLLGVTKSDSHVIANHLIAHDLRERGYEVKNLGACTPIEEFVFECTKVEYDYVLIGSLNGHALEDVKGLGELKESLNIKPRFILGGNLAVGREKEASVFDQLYLEGIDHILEDYNQLDEFLAEGRLVS